MVLQERHVRFHFQILVEMPAKYGMFGVLCCDLERCRVAWVYSSNVQEFVNALPTKKRAQTLCKLHHVSPGSCTQLARIHRTLQVLPLQ
jgi:hypothetical protein